jgi:DNA-binding SARP family transcriptional activator
MRALAAAGRRDEALRQYPRFVRSLEKIVGTGPSPDLVRLYEELRGQEAAQENR